MKTSRGLRQQAPRTTERKRHRRAPFDYTTGLAVMQGRVGTADAPPRKHTAVPGSRVGNPDTAMVLWWAWAKYERMGPGPGDRPWI
jgi:hypothetical protein